MTTCALTLDASTGGTDGQRLPFWTALSWLLPTGMALQGAVRGRARGAPLFRAGGRELSGRVALSRLPAEVGGRVYGPWPAILVQAVVLSVADVGYAPLTAR